MVEQGAGGHAVVATQQRPGETTPPYVIRTPDRRLRVFISSTMAELADERLAARRAVGRLGLVPVFFEAGARPHPPRALYRAYLDQSDVFVGIYWERYGWTAPGEEVSGLEDEYRLAGDRPRLIYVKTPAPGLEPRLEALLERIRSDDHASYQLFSTPEEFADLLANDLAVLLTEWFESADRAAAPTVVTLPDAAAPPQPGRLRVAPPLPVPPTPLVGRRREADELAALLRRADVRLVTLTGPGGIGKSRLAFEVAARLRDETCVWPVAFNTVRDAALVPATLAQALGIDERPGQQTVDVLAEELASTSMLLVIDGFEHVLDAAPVLSDLLLACPGIRMLVTSRAVLNLRAEQDYLVPSLPLPARTGTLQDVGDADAVRLFVVAAEAVSPGFRLTPSNARDVAEICRRLDGLPLAIELAAARARLLTPAALLARLTNRLSVLTEGPHDLPERQQTLRATLDWDYDLLDGEERALFRRLAVCPGGFTFELAATVAAAAGELGIEILDGLDSLVGKSLLQRRAGVAGTERFGMLDTIREYAFERLVESGEQGTTQRAHADFLLALVERADFRGPEQVRWLAEIEMEHENLRAALRCAIERGDVELELRLCAALSWFWRLHGHLVEGGGWVEGALVRSAQVQDPARLELLAGAAQFPRARGDYAAAQHLLDEALALAERGGNVRCRARAHRDLCAVLADAGEYRAARGHAEEALRLFTELGDQQGQAHCLNALGVVTEPEQDWEGAAAFYAQALPLYVAVGDRTGSALVTMNMGCVLTSLGRPADGHLLLLRSLVEWRQLENTWYLTDCLEFFSYAQSDLGDPLAAVTVLGCADALRASIGAVRAPAQQPEYDDRLASLHERLEPQEFAAAWAQGAATSYDVLIGGLLLGNDDPRIADVTDVGLDVTLVESLGLPKPVMR